MFNFVKNNWGSRHVWSAIGLNQHRLIQLYHLYRAFSNAVKVTMLVFPNNKISVFFFWKMSYFLMFKSPVVREH